MVSGAKNNPPDCGIQGVPLHFSVSHAPAKSHVVQGFGWGMRVLLWSLPVTSNRVTSVETKDGTFNRTGCGRGVARCDLWGRGGGEVCQLEAHAQRERRGFDHENERTQSLYRTDPMVGCPPPTPAERVPTEIQAELEEDKEDAREKEIMKTYKASGGPNLWNGGGASGKTCFSFFRSPRHWFDVRHPIEATVFCLKLVRIGQAQRFSVFRCPTKPTTGAGVKTCKGFASSPNTSPRPTRNKSISSNSTYQGLQGNLQYEAPRYAEYRTANSPIIVIRYSYMYTYYIYSIWYMCIYTYIYIYIFHVQNDPFALWGHPPKDPYPFP